jgi:hypothetical protein
MRCRSGCRQLSRRWLVHHQSAVNIHDFAGHERRRIGSEEARRRRDFLCFPCTLQGYVIQKFVNVLARQTEEHLGFDDCRCDRVDPNVIRTALSRSFYAARHRERHPREAQKRGPKVLSDAELVTAIRQPLDEAVFSGEGYRKIWAPRIVRTTMASTKPVMVIRVVCASMSTLQLCFGSAVSA